ncbi:MAG: recombinase RecA [Candidatus Eisenbacteria bacterium]|nr:recombinase RecA [Candidatus Eisenbacteria bacterium]
MIPNTPSAKEKTKALDLALQQIEKQFGKGAIMKLGEEQALVPVEIISTGSIALDMALGIGGIPRGRVIEIYGPESSGKTTLALTIIANAQRSGGNAVFIDAEHALDAAYAQKLGVDIANLHVAQPDTGEEALEIADHLVRSGAVDVVVIDSVAALVPRAEIEGEMGDSHVGLQARLMSQALRKLTGSISKSKTSVIFINQIRMQIGVMFGCFHYNTRVMLADGSSEKIGKIVNQKMPVEVLSYDPVTGAIEPRKVMNWFDNGPTDTFLQFEVEGGPSGRRKFAATPGHMIFTPNGEVPAGELGVGDEVLVSVEDIAISDDQRQVIIGSALGDGSLRQVGTHTATFRVGHGPEQAEYVEWKHAMLGPLSRGMARVGNGTGFDTLAAPFLADLRSQLYSADGERTASTEILAELDARGLAVWYGDDGSFGGSFEQWGKGRAVLYNKSLQSTCREAVCERLEQLGVGRPRDDGRGFWFSSGQTARLHALIAPWLHPCVQYKLHPSRRGQFAWSPATGEGAVATALAERKELRAVPAKIVKRYRKPATRATHRFDIQVEGNHSYLVDGVIVHNSPETTAGGRALKFYASVRLDIRRIATLKEGDVAVGNRTKVKVVKNKVAAPFREAEFDIVYNEGISREGELIDFGVDKGVIEKSGTWFSFGPERIGQGRENARLFLREHADVRAQLEAKLLPLLGLRTLAPPPAAANGTAERAASPPPVASKPAGNSARPQPALVASGDRKR